MSLAKNPAATNLAHRAPSHFVALGIVITDVSYENLFAALQALRPRIDSRLTPIADAGPGRARYRVEIALPDHNSGAQQAIDAWRHVKRALAESPPGGDNEVEIIDT